MPPVVKGIFNFGVIVVGCLFYKLGELLDRFIWKNSEKTEHSNGQDNLAIIEKKFQELP